MIINYYTHKPEENKTRRVAIGSRLVGIRLLSATIESNEELNDLLSEKGVSWAKRNMRFRSVFTCDEDVHMTKFGYATERRDTDNSSS